jgi:hypothetical protein
MNAAKLDLKTILLVVLGLSFALPAAAQQPQDGKAAEEARRQRERAIERCNANRGTDCATDAGLAEFMDRSRSDAEAEGARTIQQAPPKPAPRPAK